MLRVDCFFWFRIWVLESRSKRQLKGPDTQRINGGNKVGVPFSEALMQGLLC